MSAGGPVGLQRSEAARVIEHRRSSWVVGPDGRVHRFPQDSGALVAEIMRVLAIPHTADELLATLAQRFDDVRENRATVDAALDHLTKAGALATAAARQRAVPPVGRRIVLGISGAVAASMAPAVAAQLLASGHTVRVVLTKAARRFVAPAALEAITHQAVVKGLWDRSAELPTPHINLAQWAQAVLVFPATATTLSRIAVGNCGDLVSAIAVTTRAPVLLVPSMNGEMFRASAVQRNLATLIDDGFYVVQPGYGHEVAHAPSERVVGFGPAPSPREVAALLDLILHEVAVPRSAEMEAWDQRYSQHSASELPWHSDTLDGDLIDVLSVLPKPRRVLDIGTGLGVVARELARKGFEVTATDLSSVALAHAQKALAGLNVTLAHDDISQSRLEGPFDLLVDRGALHVLPVAAREGYARAVARLCAPNGHLVVKVHSEEEPRDFMTSKFTAEALEKLLAPSFEPVRTTASTLPGTVSPAPKALLGVFRRTTATS